MAGLTKQEVTKIVKRYIGVFEGYLSNFSYRSHADFYPEYCDLEIDPNQYEGTTRQRFITILESSPPKTQAKIIRGVLERFTLDAEDKKPTTRTKELYNEILTIAQRLEEDSSCSFSNDKMINQEKEIFISYAWGGDSEEFANKIDNAFQSKGITIVRDKRDLGFKESIKSFMENIGRGKAVIIIVSDKYLKSENCMSELLQIANNGQFYDRIFPIVLSDANIYKPVQLIKYVRHWEDQIKELDEEIKTVGSANLQGFWDSINLYTQIRAKIAELTSIIKDMNTLTPSIHIESDFEMLIKAIERKLEETEVKNITVKQFVANQATPDEQLVFFKQQINLVNPKQDFARSEFEAYCNLWKSLQAVRVIGDDLWENANKENIVKFSNQLRATRQEAYEYSLFFEEEDIQQLQSVFNKFGNFRVGKEKIFNIRSVEDVDISTNRFLATFTQQIELNKNCKIQYEIILEKIRVSFRRKLSEAA